MKRKYLPTLAELIDRLSIIQLKAIFIPENKSEYDKEMQLIMHDLDLIIKENKIMFNSKMIRALQINMLCNRFIWENESRARVGGAEQDKLLKLTHSINGIRNTAKNIIANEIGERKDLKVDCLAADLIKEFGNWNIFEGWS